MEREDRIHNSIIEGMSEGVMAIRFDGVIELANEAAQDILGKTEAELVGNSFVRAFFDEDENDEFIQSVLDAVYQTGRRLESYVPYRTAGAEKERKPALGRMRCAGTSSPPRMRSRSPAARLPSRR